VIELQRKFSSIAVIYLLKISTSNKLLIKTDLPLNTPVSLLMALLAQEHLAEGQLQG
jgi:hypothetical protein